MANSSGISTGKVNSGDTVTVTFSEQLDASTICSTWVNSGSSQSITDATISLLNNSSNDTITVSAPSSECSTNGNFGVVATEANYVSSGTAVTFTSSTVTWSPTNDTLTFTFGNPGGTGTLDPTAQQPTAPQYTPDSNMADLSGYLVSTLQFTAPGTSRF
jgi:hypothetical protein